MVLKVAIDVSYEWLGTAQKLNFVLGDQIVVIQAVVRGVNAHLSLTFCSGRDQQISFVSCVPGNYFGRHFLKEMGRKKVTQNDAVNSGVFV